MRTKFRILTILVASLTFATAQVHAAGPDIVLADFEGETYGDWKVTGEAFGPGPAHRVLPGQMTVTGFQGKGWVSSFNGGDKPTGTLTSPEFPIERKFLTFLIGGGGWPGETCLNLLVDGKVVRTATGPNTRPGGSEALELQSWDIGGLEGKTARVEAVDKASGGWGHINVDQVVLTNRKPVALLADQERAFVIEKRYLNLPVGSGAAVRKVTVLVDGRVERRFDIRLADAAPDWWAYLDVGPWRGARVTLRVDKLPDDSAALAAIEQGDAIKGGDDLYRERLRPQFHFSSRRGWNNDPNGLVFYRGEYHLFYQHNPYGWEWGNMHWGHAVSRDLVHWQELGDVLAPDEMGPMFSGSAVVDWKNTSGFGKDGQPPLVLLYTASGRPTVQCLAFSTDGLTFTKYAGNPIVPQITAGNRDPKVIWHEPTRRWVMVLYVGLPDPNAREDEKGRPVPKHTIHVLTSPDLKEWTVRSQVEGFYECPDLFELPIAGEKSKTTWVLSAASSQYMLGRFDGERFTPETPILTGQRGAAFYAPQTFSDMPDGRRVQIGWGRMPSPGMPFNQMMCFPCTLTLHATPEGPRLRWWPVEEIAMLRARTHTVAPLPRPLKPGDNPLANAHGELLDIQAEFEVGDAAAVGLTVRGTEVVYDSRKRTLTCNERSAPLAAEGGRVRLRILADRTSLEIFGDDGMIYMPMAILPREGKTPLEAFARGGTATLHALDVHELHSIWPGAQAAVSQAADVAIPIDVGRQLFVDDHLIAETTLTRTFHRARLHAKNPVLAPETPTEMCVLDRGSIPVAAPFDDGVFYDPKDRLFKMWYHGGWFDGNCYAVSKDGLSWERPALDVTPGTNRVLPVRFNPRGGRLLRDGTTVWLDQEASDPAQRFKMFVYSRRLTDDKSQGGELFLSADGIHWGEPQRMSGFGYGDNSSFFRDPFRNEWVFSIRRTGKSPASGKDVRVRSYLASRDFLEFTRARDDQVVDWLAADDRDTPDPAPDLGYEPQLYKVGAVAYESLMVGLFGIFYGPPNDVCDREKRPKIIDLEVGFSRDGRHFERPDRHAFIACSRQPGTWNRGYLHSAGGICLVVGDELWFYFGAWSGVSPKLGAHMYAGGSTGLAVLRRDGFASLDAGDTPGTLTTKPVTFKGRFPFVNVDAKAGKLRAEVRDVEGRVIAPFSLANCRPVTVDGTRQLLTWEGAPDLAALAGKPVRFRFQLSHGRFYSFWVSPDALGASYGYVAASGPGFTGPTDTVGGR